MSALRHELADTGGDITTALEDVLMPACLIDTEGIIRWQNPAAMAFRGPFVGFHFADLVSPDMQPEARSLIKRILCNGEPIELTIPVLTANGDYAPIQLSAAPLREGDTVVGIFGLARTADRPQAARPEGGATLTTRQQEILRMLSEGRSTDEIAAQLTLSPTTIRNHIANILAALGVHTRLQAVVAAINTGILDSEPVRASHRAM